AWAETSQPAVAGTAPQARLWTTRPGLRRLCTADLTALAAARWTKFSAHRAGPAAWRSPCRDRHA
ncbi:MAG: hypothetical protein J2P28_09560, partial [Actinobacteria bacterium]|nr:hypothetical protein [Actinomycetota bacterium]